MSDAPSAEQRLLAGALRALMGGAEINRVPVDLHRVAQRFGIRVVEQPLESREALYLRTPRESRIFLDSALFDNQGLLTGRGRFTLAHEIAHHVLEQEIRKTTLAQARLSTSRREALADQLGSHLLLPRDLLRSSLIETQPEGGDGDIVDATTMIALQRRFRVSLPALAHAVRDLVPNVVFIRFARQKAQQKGREFGEQVYRVVWSSPTGSGMNGRIFPNQRLARSEELEAAAVQGITIRNSLLLDFRPLPRRIYKLTGTPYRTALLSGFLLSVAIQPSCSELVPPGSR